MKVRLKVPDFVNNVDAGTIFDALNERGGAFDYDFPYWHGWVVDISGARKFLSYSKADLELVMRPEIDRFFKRLKSGELTYRVQVNFSYSHNELELILDSRFIKLRQNYILIGKDEKESLTLTPEEELAFHKLMEERMKKNRAAFYSEDSDLLKQIEQL